MTSDERRRLRTFAPPYGPSDLVGSTSGLHDDPLIGGAERLGKEGQRGLNEPRFEDHPCGFVVRIEFPGHSQWLQCTRDAPGCDSYQDIVFDTVRVLLPTAATACPPILTL
jgi:hypothetical protein